MSDRERPPPLETLRTVVRQFDRRVQWPDGVEETVHLLGVDHQLPLTVGELEGAVVVAADLPGVRAEDIRITITTDGTLHITAECTSQKRIDEESYQYLETRRHVWSRELRLPQGLHTDAAAATLAEGTLRVRIPRTTLLPRTIPVYAR